MPDGNTIQATHPDSLDLTHLGIDLPPQALEASIFPGLQRPLISLGMLCDTGLPVLLTSDSVSIMKNNKTIQIVKQESNGLWSIILTPPQQ